MGSIFIRLNDARQPIGLDRESFRPRCFRCFRPQSQCYCALVPEIKNQTEIVLVQHVSERDHPFNTARMVRSSLDRTKLVSGDSKRLADANFELGESAGLLYPSSTAMTLSNIPKDERPSQLVVIDGTWPQAKTLVRDLPQLKNLPHYQLVPTQPGNYRIRLEPDDVSLSTLEAVVQALRELEPELLNLDKLIGAFETMVQRQLDHPKVKSSHYSGGRKSGRSLNIPRGLLFPERSIVVAYGELECRSDSEANRRQDLQRGPLVWSAHRLEQSPNSHADNFESFLSPKRPLTSSFLSHLELSKDHFENCETANEFRERWSRFFRDGDTLVVCHPSGVRMLENVNAKLGRWMTLKSINFSGRDSRRTLSEFVKDECQNINVSLPQSGRAGKRLSNAVALVLYLREVGLKNAGAGVK